MKNKRIIRIFLILALQFVPLMAGAQIYVGGHIGLATDGDKLGVNLAPEVGYGVNQYLTVGGNISYHSLYNTFGVTPYARLHFLTLGNIARLYAEATAPMRFASGYQNYNLFLRPGVSLRLGDSVWLMATIGAFGYSWYNSGGVRSDGWYAKVDGNTVSIGFCFGI